MSKSQLNLQPGQQADQAVISYLRKRGFQNAESALAREMESSLDHFVFDSQLIDSPVPLLAQQPSSSSDEAAGVVDSYQKLQRFIEDSLDLYKSELQAILYPLFVHVFLDLICRGYVAEASRFFETYKQDFSQQFPADMQQLGAVTDPLHVRQNAVASLYRQNKYTLLMSSYAFELFLSYLMDSHFMTLLKLVNQFINIKVYSTKPIQSMRQDSTVVGITGHTSQQIQSVNQQVVYPGRAPLEPHFQEALERRLKGVDAEKSVDADIPSLTATFQSAVAEDSKAEFMPRDEAVPLPPKTNYDVVEMVEALNDARMRVKLSPADMMPSAVTYTLHNTYSTLTSVSFSADDKMMATGSSDSYIRVWSLTGDRLRSLKGSTEYSAADFEKVDSILDGCEEEGDFSKRLIGHSGPVYDTCFSSSGKHLISGSEDGTARLWGMHTFSNLVAYRGHNLPIWSVDFGAQGYYFATASHDRTARVWSCERPNALRIFAGHLSDVECVKFHPNSNYIVTSSADRTVRLWDVHSGKCVRLFTSSLSASGGNGAGQLSNYLPGHPTRTATLLSVAVSPDGHLMASGGDDGSIVVWDLASGRVMKRYGCTSKMQKSSVGKHAHQKSEDRLENSTFSSAVYSMDFSADGAVLSAGYADGHLRVFKVKEGGETDGVISERDDLIADFCTKRTPIHRVKFTKRNLLLTAGPFMPYI